MDLSIYLRYYSAAGIYFSFRWGPFVHSLEIVQWDSTRRDHPGNLGGVSGSGPVTLNLKGDDCNSTLMQEEYYTYQVVNSIFC